MAAILGVLAGLALALDEAGSTLAYLQTIPQGFADLPRPANLDWIAGWAGLARSLTVLHGLWALIAAGALLGLGRLVFRTLNPAFRLTAPLPAQAEAGAMLRQPLDRRWLGRIAGALLVSLWLLGYFGVWLPGQRSGLLDLLAAGPTGLARQWPQARVAASVAGLVLLLAGLWLVWGEAGLLRPPAEGPRRGLLRALGAAALAGLVLAPFAMPLTDWAQGMATEVLQGIGGAARGVWLAYLGGVLVLYPLALGAAGWTAMSLARWTHFPWERRALGAGLAVAAVAWLGAGALLNIAGAGRFDDGIPLARAAGVPVGAPGVLASFTLLPGERPVVGLTPVVSDQGLAATDASARRVWAYLRRRRFRTVHLFPALMHVCQCEALDWDSDRLLETTLLSLSCNPQPGFCRLLVEKLWHCAATPQARGALARLQDPRWFHFPARELAALRRRLGAPGGMVRGRLWVNGAPARGMQVGLVDERLWTQFRGMPRSLSHRLVVAGGPVDAAGAFRLDRIPAGRYFLLARLPALRGFWLPLAVWTERSPGPIAVPASPRAVNVGVVRLTLMAPRWRRGPRSARKWGAATRYLPPLSVLLPVAPGTFMSHPAQQ